MSCPSLFQLRAFSSKVKAICNTNSTCEDFSELFKKTHFYQLSPNSDQMIIIDKSKDFKEYASFFKRPIPSIHGKHNIGIRTSVLSKNDMLKDRFIDRKIAISLKTSSNDGKSFFFDAPFGELDYVDRTADYLRYKFLESISMTIGITHVKKKSSSKKVTTTHPNLLLGDILLENPNESFSTTFLHELTTNSKLNWSEKISKVITREELYKLAKSPTLSLNHATKRYVIPQIPKPLRGFIISSSNSANASLRVRGKIVGFADGMLGFAVSVSGWIAHLPLSILANLKGITSSAFLSELVNVHLDSFFVTNCLLDTETGSPIITLTLDISSISGRFDKGSDTSQATHKPLPNVLDP